MSTARRYLPHYTVTDYQQWEGDWELWQGIPVATSPSPLGPHQACGANLLFELKRAIQETGCHATALYEIDWIISQDTVVRPDVLVICGDAPQRHVEHPPAVVIEITSPGTADRDRTAKLELYQDHGVSYYLLVDPLQRDLIVLERNDQGRLQRAELAEEVSLRICDTCSLRFAPAPIFR